MTQTERIRTFILDHLPNHSRVVTALAQEVFGISRQAIARHVQALIRAGLVESSGQTRGRILTLATTIDRTFTYSLDAPLSEDTVWNQDVAPLMADLAPNVRDIWHYSVTEMVNNAIDHSDGTALTVWVEGTAIARQVGVSDDGVGIFSKIQRSLGLEDARLAVLELAKGKFTTDPDRHTGEGIFFTSRAVDRFRILASGVHATHEDGAEGDWIVGTEPSVGTAVSLELRNGSDRALDAVFERYASPEDDYVFTKTIVPVHLVRYGAERVVSRSQAKRLMHRLDRFSKILLDFTGIDAIGQPFADEVFRVFANAHPAIEISPINENAQVARMIRRVRGHR